MHVFPDVIQYAIGIDNGLDGAVAVIPVPHGRSASIKRTPTVKSLRIPKVLTQDEQRKVRRGKMKAHSKSSRDYNFLAMIRTFALLRKRIGPDAKVVAIMESPQMRRGPGGKALSTQATMRSMQHGQTCWQLALRFSDIPLFEISSATWKADLDLSKKDKDASISLAMQLFPRAPVVKHDECEALLMAYWLAHYYEPGLLRT